MPHPRGVVGEIIRTHREYEGEIEKMVLRITPWHHIVSKGAKIRSRYNQVPHPTQDTNGKVTNSQLDTTNESQEQVTTKQK